eukprot:2428545-Rhodomonas_salina.1
MALRAVVGAVLVQIDGRSTPRVYVAFGAPLGSMLLRPSTRMTRILQILFYILALVQFGSFAVLKLKRDVGSWVMVLVGVAAAAVGSIAQLEMPSARCTATFAGHGQWQEHSGQSLGR